jgi:hypothetical protein
VRFPFAAQYQQAVFVIRSCQAALDWCQQGESLIERYCQHPNSKTSFGHQLLGSVTRPGVSSYMTLIDLMEIGPLVGPPDHERCSSYWRNRSREII